MRFLHIIEQRLQRKSSDKSTEFSENVQQEEWNFLKRPQSCASREIIFTNPQQQEIHWRVRNGRIFAKAIPRLWKEEENTFPSISWKRFNFNFIKRSIDNLYVDIFLPPLAYEEVREVLGDCYDDGNESEVDLTSVSEETFVPERPEAANQLLRGMYSKPVENNTNPDDIMVIDVVGNRETPNKNQSIEEKTPIRSLVSWVDKW